LGRDVHAQGGEGDEAIVSVTGIDIELVFQSPDKKYRETIAGRRLHKSGLRGYKAE
jgi:hypothetical protein